jgi:ribA/ribD-fused uncharacterized protein
MRFKSWLESLQQEIRFYDRDQEQYGFLSNFYPAPFVIDGVNYPTVEHFYVTMKSEDPEYRRQILASPTPGKAKRLGDARHKQSLFVKGMARLRDDWESVKYSVMEVGVRAKFTQNVALGVALKATGSVVLVEDSPGDLVWGTGPIDEKGNYRGQNLLGKILMEVRSEI